MKFISLLLTILASSLSLADSPIIFDGTYEFSEVIPLHTDWKYMIHGGSTAGKETLKSYRENGFTCKHVHSLRYQCEKREKGKIPHELNTKLTNQYQDYYLDFEPYQEIKNINEQEWRFNQIVIINEEVFFSYMFNNSRFPHWLDFSSGEKDIRINAISRRELRINVRKSSKEATAHAFIKMVKLTP